MKILVIATKYSLKLDSPWLTNELAESLQKQGNEVTVLFVDWDAKECLQGPTICNSIKVICIPALTFPKLPNTISKALKWLFSSINAYRHFKSNFRHVHFDVLIGFSPCTALWFCFYRLRRRAEQMVLVYWDFFPIHNYQIGKVPSRLLNYPLYILERYLVSVFDYVGLMSDKNIAFFKEYFPLNGRQKIFELPIWGRRIVIKYKDLDEVQHNLKQQYGCVAVFGGQLEYGRGIENLLSIAKQLRNESSDIGLLIIGEGPLKAKVIEASSDEMHNLIYLSKLSREDYLKVLSVCDIGIVSTQAEVTIPSYPSKCIDYLISGLPVIASVEATTDFGEIIEAAGCGYYCLAGDDKLFVEKIKTLAMDSELRKVMGKAGRDFFENRHNVDAVAAMLLNQVHNL